MTNHDDPWRNLNRPGSKGELITRREAPNSPWDFYWGVGFDGALHFLIKHGDPAVEKDRIPVLRGLTITDIPDGNERLLLLRLEASENRDIFAILCRDIVEVSRFAPDQKTAVNIALSRTWRWHHLLRGGNTGLLSSERQRGLIAELQFLVEVAIPAVGRCEAIRAWQGPYDNPKDFVFGATAVEVKSKRRVGPSRVKISSPEQLDDTGFDALYLHIRDVDAGEEGDVISCNLDGIVAALLADFEKAAPESVIVLEAAIMATGYSPRDDYSSYNWVLGDTHDYRVESGFPRIVPGILEVGVEAVTYSLALDRCKSWNVARGELLKSIRMD